jgi:hypothetical protein
MLIFDRCMCQITGQATAETLSVGRLQGWLRRRGLRQQPMTKDDGCTGSQGASVKATGRQGAPPAGRTD